MHFLVFDVLLEASPTMGGLKNTLDCLTGPVDLANGPAYPAGG